MRTRAQPPPSAPAGASVPARWAPAALLLLALLAYHNSFQVPFLFDDLPAIRYNPSIERLWPLADVLWPEQAGGVTTTGRPLVNLTLALNHAISGEAVWSYHAVNLLIHGAAGLLLYGLVRRTLQLAPVRDRLRTGAAAIAFATAALWMVHPLQTVAVTYIVQRAEALMALAYLLVLYALLRGAQSPRPGGWYALATGACFLGMAAKESMVSAPLVALAYDRVFLSGSFREAWRRRGRVHLALASSWLLLALLVFGTAGRGETAGFTSGISPWLYLLTQAGAILHYLRLALWPHPLVFDYGTGTVAGVADAWFPLLVIIALLGLALWAWLRRPALGFLGLVFFALLAPSSSLVPIASQTIAEHRMYLPLLVPVLLLILGLQRWLGGTGLLLAGFAGIAAGAATVARNEDFQTARSIWADTVAKRPDNARAHHNLGQALLEEGDVAAALSPATEAARLDPSSPEAHYNRGLVLSRLGRWAEAAEAYEQALQRQPDHAEAHNNLGNACLARGEPARAIAHYEAAIAAKPAFADAYSNLSNALLATGQIPAAIARAEEAIRLQPGLVEAHYNLGNALVQAARFRAAARAYEQALALDPGHVGACHNLGNVLLELDQLPAAAERFAQAVALQPDFLPARRTLVPLLAHLGRFSEAREHARVLVELAPQDRGAREALARLEAQSAEPNGAR